MNIKPKASRIFFAMMTVTILAAGCDQAPHESEPSQASSAAATGTDIATVANAKSSGSSGDGTYSSSGMLDSAGSSATSGTPLRVSASDAATQARTVIEDSVITTKVKAALLADPDTKSTNISVETNQGEVTINGSVDNQPQMNQAEKIARGVAGVKVVNNKLSVKKS